MIIINKNELADKPNRVKCVERRGKSVYAIMPQVVILIKANLTRN